MKQIVFGVTGGLFPYFLGIAKFLQQNYCLQNCIFSGCSGGIQPAFFLASDIKIETAWNSWLIPTTNDILKNKNVITGIHNGKLFSLSKNHLTKMISNDHYQTLNNKLFVSVTSLYPFENLVITDFESNDDLFNTIIASQYLPFIDLYPVIRYRKRWCMDGGLTNPIPVPIPEKPALIFKINKYRKFSIFDHMISFNKNKLNLLYNYGYIDAKTNKLEFDKYGLKRLSL